MTYDANSAAPGPFTSTQVVTPSSGNTVAADGSNVMFVNNPGLLTALSVQFPTNPRDGQVFSFSARSQIAVLTMSASQPIYGGVTAMVASGFARYAYSSVVGAWFRLG